MLLHIFCWNPTIFLARCPPYCQIFLEKLPGLLLDDIS